mmetsp:Transcript_18815/g.17963  ORF Transcript_18815/g.17963 Transcript_18815/m.17963 type:complete len:141 (+) Transcript_18815:960-1382(+)
MTRNLYAEFEKLQKRMEQVGDPLYTQQLRRKNEELDGRIRALQREQKNLMLEQQRREKRLDKIIQAGEPEILRDVQQAHKQLNVSYDKLKTVTLSLKKMEETKELQDTRRSGWEEKLQQVIEKAESIGIDTEVLLRKPPT